ncbi:MAG: hypothetical protein DUD39_16875 [Coriobacteriaceae bacterium]|nr:MAG: hypothetical protein DUD39_16875 [Coriobacteriaceae bacterium]
MCSACWMPWAEVAFSGEFPADRAGYESLVEAMRNRAVSPSWRSCGPSETRGAAAPEEIHSKFARMGTFEMMRSLARKMPKGAELVADSLLMLQALAKNRADELEELVQDNAPALLKI